ncbi:TetR/AcrR family transcriptional regulator [Solibacillus sp. FSL K6-1554]|uniref:TetR/AcrR family transcriptional regulator n=1 Tax=Solibacillus sp. FSL K6-1554 TaxID=2921472 RepID=UPI0030F8B650
MKKTLRELKMEKKKSDILRVAIDLLAVKGYERTTMEDVAQELLMTKGSLYYYFANKEELYFECNMMIIDESIKLIEEIYNSQLTTTQKLEELIYQYIIFQINEKPIFSLANNLQHIFSEQNFLLITEGRDKFNQILDRIIKEGIKNKEFHTEDVKLTRFLMMGALNSIQAWYKPNGDKTPEEIAKVYADQLLRILK